MKALILAGGRGKRLGEFSEEKNKCMVAVNNRSLIEYSLSCLTQLDISEIIIVIGYRGKEIKEAYGDSFKDRPIKYIIQSEQKGLVHAIECAQSAVGRDDFMLMLGDELMLNPRHQAMVDFFKKENLFGVCGVVEVQDRELIKRTYSVVAFEDSRIDRLIEKPSHPANDIMGTGNCIFKNAIFSYIPQTPINQKRGERELPDLIQCAIDDGQIVKTFPICDHYVNVNVPEEIKKAESYFAHF